ncbi:MAG: hypothetical protein IJ748_00895, partial [Bacteroidales bacterium]|nr:hypothetical protein [Bacteroidales bacterium]
MNKNYIFLFIFSVFVSFGIKCFGQIAPTTHAEIKDVPNVYCYPKHTAIAIANDSTSVLYSRITVNGFYAEGFYLVHKENPTIREAIVKNNLIVEDIDIIDNLLCFCGQRDQKAFIAWADVDDFFSTGEFKFMEINISSPLFRIRAYRNSSNEINFACLDARVFYGSASKIVQFNLSSLTFIVSDITPPDDYEERVSDIIVYGDYILVSGYIKSTNSTLYSWDVRVYNKDDISVPSTADNLHILGNNPTYRIDNRNYAFLAKSEDEKKLVLVAVANTEATTSSSNGVIVVYDLVFDQDNNIEQINRYDIESPINIAMLWGADICIGSKYYYELVIQTFDGGYFSSVFHTNLTYPLLQGCQIYTNHNIGMFSSIRTYAHNNFISIGDIDIFLGIWDRSTLIGLNPCEINNTVNVT